MTDLEQAILNTLLYSDHFGFPLTFEEIYLRLVGAGSSRPHLRLSLLSLVRRGQIVKSGLYYHLPGRNYLVSRRQSRARLAAPKLVRAASLAARLGRLPGVLAVCATGSLAVKNTKPDDDLDLMLITKPGRLWTTRLLVTLYSTLFGLRRTPHSTHNSDKICLNLYLDPAGFSLPPARRSLYSAYELVQALPLYDPGGLYPRLLAANSWVQNFLPNFKLPAAALPSFIIHRSSFISRFIESIAYWFQRQYMSRRITREHITPHSAFFHPRDPGRSVLRKLSLWPYLPTY